MTLDDLERDRTLGLQTLKVKKDCALW